MAHRLLILLKFLLVLDHENEVYLLLAIVFGNEYLFNSEARILLLIEFASHDGRFANASIAIVVVDALMNSLEAALYNHLRFLLNKRERVVKSLLIMTYFVLFL